jgi:chromosome segregation ATPase
MTDTTAALDGLIAELDALHQAIWHKDPHPELAVRLKDARIHADTISQTLRTQADKLDRSMAIERELSTALDEARKAEKEQADEIAHLTTRCAMLEQHSSHNAGLAEEFREAQVAAEAEIERLKAELKRYREVAKCAEESEAADLMAYIGGEDESEIAKLKASLAYTAAALGREIAIAKEQADEIERLRKKGNEAYALADNANAEIERLKAERDELKRQKDIEAELATGLTSDAMDFGMRAEVAESRCAALTDALTEARLQIVYLHEKFAVTGSGNAVIAHIDRALATEVKGNGNV